MERQVMDIAKLQAEIQFDEGSKLMPYRDSRGLLSIGVGRCLERVGISEDEQALMFKNDLTKVTQNLDKLMPWWKFLPDGPARGLCNMAFNLGISGLLGFKVFLAHMEKHEFGDAAIAVAHSRAAQQLPHRYSRICLRIDPAFVIPGWMK